MSSGVKKNPPTWMRGCVAQRIIGVFPTVDMLKLLHIWAFTSFLRLVSACSSCIFSAWRVKSRKNKLIGFTAEKTMYSILSPKNNFNKNLHIHIMILKQTDRNQSQLKHFKYHLLSHVVLGYSPVTRTTVSWGRRDMVVEWVVMLDSTLRRQLLLQDLW